MSGSSCTLVIIPERSSSLLQPERRRQLTMLQEHERGLKRKASELSSTSSQDSREEFIDVQSHLIQNQDSQLRILQVQLLDSWKDGNLPEPTYRKEFHDIVEKRLRIAAEEVTLARSRERILNQLMGAVATMEPDMRAAYTDIMTQEFMGKVKKYGTKRALTEQMLWKTQLETWYGATMSGDKNLLWCPVLKDFGYRKRRCASHIAPYRLGPRNLEHLFGQEKGEGEKIMWRFENAIIVDKVVETAFDNGHLTIVPVDKPKGEPTAFKVLLLNEEWRGKLFDGHGTRTFGDFDGVELRFRNSNRPDKRYLYYHFCTSILRAVRFQTPGWANARLASQGRIWATWGPYLRRSMLLKIGEQLGDTELPYDFLKSGTFEGEHTVSKETEELMAKEIVVAEVEPILVEADDEESAQDSDGTDDMEDMYDFTDP